MLLCCCYVIVLFLVHRFSSQVHVVVLQSSKVFIKYLLKINQIIDLYSYQLYFGIQKLVS